MGRYRRRLRHAATEFVLICTLSLAYNAAPLAQDAVYPTIDNELILSLNVRNDTVSEALLAYWRDDQVLLPLQELGFLLEFPIFVDADGQGAEGWFLDQDRTLEIDLDSGDVLVEGRRAPFVERYVVPIDSEIYVSTDLLARWLPLEFEVNLASSLVKIRPLEALPSEVAAARAERQAGLYRPTEAAPDRVRVELPYRLIELPVVDVNLDAGFDSEDSELRSFHDTVIASDLLWLNGTVFLTGTNQGIDLFRVNLARRDPDAELLGPLRATRLEVGDVGSPSHGLVARAASGRGAGVGNFPLSFVSEFDRVTLQGDLRTNFEVELYRNDQLIDFQAADTGNRYRFDDVPLLVGANDLRLVFYGPQGQSYQREERFFVGPGQVPPGTLHYRLSALQQDRSLLGLDNEVRIDPDDRATGKVRLLAEAEYGLTRALSLSAAAGLIPLADESSRSYATTGLRTSLLGTFANLDVAIDDEGGQAYRVGAQGLLGPVNLSLNHDLFRAGFVGEVRGEGIARRKHQSEARATTRLLDFAFIRNPYIDLDVGYSKQANDQEIYEAGLALSTLVERASVANRIGVELRNGGGRQSEDSVVGDISLGGRIGDLSLRGGLDYEIAPDVMAEAVDITASYPLSERTAFSFAVERELELDETTSYTARISRDFDIARLGFVARYTDDDNLFAGLSVSFSAYYDRAANRPMIVAESNARRGMALPRAFLDMNSNGTFEAEEPLLTGVEFNARGSRSQARTGTNGKAMLTSLPTHAPIGIAVRPESLESPYWRPTAKRLEIVPRPGRVAILDVPILPTIEIDGMVTFLNGNGEVPASNVLLQLVDTRIGKVAAEARSEFDGFYFFEGIGPGLYILQIDPGQRLRLGLAEPAPKILVVSSETEIISDQNFRLQRHN